MTGNTVVALLRPERRSMAIAFDILTVLAGSLLIAVCAQIVIPLSFTPVPITGQTFAVLLVAAVAGGSRGAASCALYLAEGSAGLPFFNTGGAGIAHLAGPTGGYLVGFVAAGLVIGWLADRGWTRSYGKLVVALLVGMAVIYLFGAARLALFIVPAAEARYGLRAAVANGVLPFLPGDLLKIAAIVGLLPTGWRLVRRGDNTESTG